MNNIFSGKYTFLNYTIAFFFLSAPIESIAIFDNISIAKFAALFVLIGWAFQKFKMSKSHIIYSFIVLALYATATIIWSIDRSNTINHIFGFLWPSIIIAIAINSSITQNEDIYLYLISYIVGSVVAIVSTFLFRDVALAAAQYSGEERLTAFGQDQNTLAFLLCVSVTIVLDFIRKTRRKLLKYFSMAIVFSAAIAILSTGSRTGLMLFLSVAFLYLISKGNLKNSVIMVLLVIFMFPLIYDYIPSSIWDRFSETGDLIEGGDFSGRGAIWAHGLTALAEENIVIGVGYSNFSTMLKNHLGWQIASHNTYLSYFADLGIVGFVIFLSIIFKMLKIVAKISKIEKDIYIFAYIIPFIIVMFVLETEYKRWLFMFGVMIESYYRLNYAEYYKS